MSHAKDGARTVEFPGRRRVVIDTMRAWGRPRAVHGLIEVDVSDVLRLIDSDAARIGAKTSLTAFIIGCLGQAVAEQKEVQAVRDWRGRLVVFEDVDVATVVEKVTPEGKVPVSTVIRHANERTAREIQAEIRSIQEHPGIELGARRSRAAPLLVGAPQFLRDAMYRVLGRNPRWMKRHVGTVGLTAVGMFASGGGWAIPVPILPLFVTVGGIARKPGVVNGIIEARDYLSLTVSFDHDVIDGAPAARFTSRLKELLEAGHGLPR